MLNLFPNKKLTALVTGGSRGIGRAISLRLAETCAETVIVNYLQNDEAANETRLLIEERQSSCVLVRSNLAFPEEIEQLFDQVQRSVQHLNLFIHCAALNSFKPLLNIKPNQWDLIQNINARSFLICAQKAVPLMKDGKLIAISSLGSQRVVPGYGAMGPTKAALEAIVRYLAVELSPMGISVNGVSGGLIETESIKRFPQSMIEQASARTPAHRLGTPEEIADVVLFLVSPLARWIYGQIIVADGGLSLL